MTKPNEQHVLDRLKAAGQTLAPMLGGRLAQKPSGNEPQLGGDRAVPMLRDILKQHVAAGGEMTIGGAIPVAGVTFEGRQKIIDGLDGTEPCYVVPEPDNPYDANAVAVWVHTKDGPRKVGFVPRALAEVLAPILAGRSARVTIQNIVGRRGNFRAWNQGIRIE